MKHSKNVTIFGISILAALLMIGLVANQAMAAPPSPKVTICHVMSSHDITITVGTTAVKAHLDHGDHIGACNSCGDGNLDDQEQSAGYCDDGNNDNTDACTNTCAVAACGDGYTQAGETCDDGNTTGGDGCDATCQTESVCGNGTVEAGETCDDGNTATDDGCSATCQTESGYSCEGNPSACTTICGDSVQAGTETCDDGNTTGGDGCDATCQIEEYCGDGIVNGSEDCDGSDLNGATCNTKGFDEGTLSCNQDCTFNTNECVLFS